MALVREGDTIHLDADELARRRQARTPPAPRYTSGVLAKYAEAGKRGTWS
jgi:dihydroxy-acid dehydratase